MLMKKIFLFASAALLFAGCAKENITPIENPDNSQKGDITLSFSASQTGFGTKAVIGATTGEGTSKSTAINWQSTDQISVFDGANENCQFSTKNFSTETTTSCTFEGNVNAVATDYTAVYPYTEGAKISETGVISGVTLPAIQTAVVGSFDSSAALMVAKTVAGVRELAFQNLVGYVKVTTDFDCKQIELCAASGEKLAGEGTITFTDGTPSFALGEGAESTITLLPEGEGTTIAAGTYYIAVSATTLAEGWKISFTATNGNVYSRQGTKQIQFKTNTVINLGTIKLDDLIPYVTFTAESEQTFNMYSNYFPLGENEYFEYSVGGGEWVRFTVIVKNIKFGGCHGNLRLRGKSSKGTATDYNDLFYSEIQFTTNDSPVDCTGDIRTLIDYENYANANTSDARFCNLFNMNTALRTAPSLPAKTLASSCYYGMFKYCSSLTTAPDLPAETLASSCYQEMFSGCTSLTTAPDLPAETLASNCYDGMFYNCKALTTAPDLPAKTLASNCYHVMFSYCSKLTTAPDLPAEILASNCYQEMFWGCTSLTTAPELPAFDLASSCYQGMFSGCTSLTTAPLLSVNFLTENCFKEMFFSCTKLSSVTLITGDPRIEGESFNLKPYFWNWLNGAGIEVDSPRLYLEGSIGSYYGYLSYINSGYLNNENYFPENWIVPQN